MKKWIFDIDNSHIEDSTIENSNPCYMKMCDNWLDILQHKKSFR